MRHLLIAIALVGTAASAAADEPAPTTGITTTQTFDGMQDGSNFVTINGLPGRFLNDDRTQSDLATLPPLDDTFDRQRGATIDQSVLNAANILLSSATTVSLAQQVNVGTQRAENGVTLFHAPGSSATVRQTGENLTNIIVADQVNEIEQAFGPGAAQLVDNAATLRGGFTEVDQTGRNTANVVVADISIGGGAQIFPEDTVQDVRNVARFVDTGARGRVSQQGTNIGNVLVADEVQNVTRVFEGDQIVRNMVETGGGPRPSRISQSGLNIANFVAASRIVNLSQVSGGRQIVENTVDGKTLAELDDRRGVSQSSTNIVNLLHVTRPNPGGGGDFLRAEQTALQPQSATGGGGGRHTQIGNAAMIDR
ncbi:hypothetical protein JQC91_10705 [Jannaschia sp. Os4]|uniref:hypothetical protein n=1 Tax=Jannaschia sp. Os4 TaxID=2807617 RepID=UPI00193AC332|nr:hypothetical protein [Jannaschia sp. Os4]MBM2576773.1 hypothetical protein [Jannaschia sp. Os4]